MTTFQKIVKYIAMGFAIGLAVFIISIIIDTVTAVIDGIAGADDTAVTGTYTYSNIEDISVDLGFGEMYIRSEGDEFIVNAKEIWGFTISEENGSLKIRSASKNFFSDGKDSSLEIIVPEGCVLAGLDVEIGAGECTVEDIYAKSMKFDSGVGELDCRNITADTCRVDAGVGEVRLSFADRMEDYSIVLDKGIGSVSINGEDYSESRHKNNGADRTIDVDCGIGEIEIKFEK